MVATMRVEKRCTATEHCVSTCIAEKAVVRSRKFNGLKTSKYFTIRHFVTVVQPPHRRSTRSRRQC